MKLIGKYDNEVVFERRGERIVFHSGIPIREHEAHVGGEWCIVIAINGVEDIALYAGRWRPLDDKGFVRIPHPGNPKINFAETIIIEP